MTRLETEFNNVNSKTLSRLIVYRSTESQLKLARETVKFLDTKKFMHSLSWSATKFSVWVLSFAVFFIVLWPAMWTDASLALRTLEKGVVDVGIEGGHLQLFQKTS